MRMRPSGSQQDRRLSPHPYFILSETPEEFEGTEYGAGGGRTQRRGWWSDSEAGRVGLHKYAYVLVRLNWLTRHSHRPFFLNCLSVKQP